MNRYLNKGVAIRQSVCRATAGGVDEEPGRVVRRGNKATFAAGVMEEFTDTVIFQQTVTVPGGPLSESRYRR